jgi:hypothetical protein
LPISCVLIAFTQIMFTQIMFAQSGLATAHGSFLVDGWRVWNNASVFENARVETGTVAVRISLPSRQSVLLAPNTQAVISGRRISVLKGCVQLNAAGEYTLDAPLVRGLAAGSDASNVNKSGEIQHLYDTVRELRPLSQRP